MQEISINLPIIFQILSPKEELFWLKTMRLYIEKKYAFGKKLAILFAGVVKYHCQIISGGVERFPKNAEICC